MNFGEHFTLDGYRGDFAKLNSRAIVLRALKELPKKLGMHVLAAPHAYHAPDNNKKDPGGWSGFVIIAESHISIHTFPARGFVSIDVYTCQNGMDIKFIIDYFTDAFGLAAVEKHFIKRGTKYPVRNIYPTAYG